jgi:acyl-CoA reductase-like NAD-dependent aldehyde dehydrogenase
MMVRQLHRSCAQRRRPAAAGLSEARAGRFDVVVAEALDRLSRDQEDTASLYKHLGFAGVRLVTEFLSGYIEDAASRNRPARVVNPGGGEVEATYFAPALLYPVTPEMRIFHEEQFGPVVPVVPFDDVDEPLAHIVNSNYGLQASVFSRDPAAVGRLIDVSLTRLTHQRQRPVPARAGHLLLHRP